MITFIRLFKMYRKHGYTFAVSYGRAMGAAKDLYGDVAGRAL